MSRYRIVPDGSRVWIDARSNVHPIHSSTDGLEGFVELELDGDGRVRPDSATGGKLSLAVARLSSGNRMEDRELQKRIDGRRFPTIEGVLDTIDGAGADGSVRVTGELTFRGVARRYTDAMTIRNVDDRTIRLDGSARFDIRDFGMQPPHVLMLKVEPEVDVRVEILAAREE
ncbi:MAG: YceI family protein [Acidimicrobiales bacterium]